MSAAYHMLNATVLSFSVFTYCDQIDITVGSWVSFYWSAGSHIGVETEYSVKDEENDKKLYSMTQSSTKHKVNLLENK